MCWAPCKAKGCHRDQSRPTICPHHTPSLPHPSASTTDCSVLNTAHHVLRLGSSHRLGTHHALFPPCFHPWALFFWKHFLKSTPPPKSGHHYPWAWPIPNIWRARVSTHEGPIQHFKLVKSQIVNQQQIKYVLGFHLDIYKDKFECYM